MNKLIVIMIDGISSKQFHQMRDKLPHLNQLAQQGTQVSSLTPEVCGTSYPGRTSMIVGRPPSEHGIYGNKIWDGNVFRWSNPYDVRAETIASLTHEAGGDVFNMGFGMVRPEDCSLYISPWWVDDVMIRGRDDHAHEANERWTMKGKNLDPEQRLSQAGLSKDDIVNPMDNRSRMLELGSLADFQLIEMAAKLIESGQTPNLVLLEIAVTDYYLHQFGTDDPNTELSLRIADAQIGTLIERLRNAGQLEHYNFAVMSDHGHTLMEETIHCDLLLPEGTRWSSEGSMLFVNPRSAAEATEITKRVLAEGMELWSKPLLPDDIKSQMLVFSCPEGQYISFESDLKNTGQIRGISKYRSNHGMRPGTEEDYRFCIFSGPNIPQQTVDFAEAIQIAPTIAAILGVETPWTATSII